MSAGLRRTRRELEAENEQLRAQLAANGKKRKLLTREQIKRMSTEELNARWPEVAQSLAAGMPSRDDDEEDEDE